MNPTADTATLTATEYATIAFNAAREVVKAHVANGGLPMPTDAAEATAMVDMAARIYLAQDDQFRALIGTEFWNRVNAA